MKKNSLSKSQVVALLVTLRKELSTIFTTTSDLDKIKDGFERKKRILDDLAFLIKEGFKVDPEETNIYELFNKF